MAYRNDTCLQTLMYIRIHHHTSIWIIFQKFIFPAGRKVFRDFLRSEFSEENILFWLACEELKKESSPEAIEEKARLIYEDYISILSPREVSLDSRVREIVNRNMVEPTPHTFDEAQIQIYTLMHRDSYPRWVFRKSLWVGDLIKVSLFESADSSTRRNSKRWHNCKTVVYRQRLPQQTVPLKSAQCNTLAERKCLLSRQKQLVKFTGRNVLKEGGLIKVRN